MIVADDLFAVVTSAVLAVMDGEKSIVIRSIKRVSKRTNNWAFAGRRKRTWR